MSRFFKNVLSSCLGVFLAILVFFVVMSIWAGSLMSSGASIAKDNILQLDLNGVIPEQTDNVQRTTMNFDSETALGLRRINDLIDHAATDSKIKGILIKNGNFAGGQATLLSIRKHLAEFKKSDKFIWSYADLYSQGGYMLASVADSVFINPQGMIDLKGYAVMIPYFKELMDELGVKANIFYAGNFKSATEPFRRNDMSPANKLQTREYLDGMYDVFAQAIEENRGISRSQMDAIVSDLKGRNAKLALENKLVDEIAYITDIENRLKRKVGRKVKKKLRTVNLDKYNTVVTLDESESSDAVAVVYAEGNVTYGTKDKGVISEAKLVGILDKLKYKEKVKAVVLRVNSGGGSALTSDIIHHEMAELKAAGKKVIASFGDVAASGGYYIAANADTIVAAPNTITGSIGVFSMMPNVRELVTQKLRLNFDTIKTHPLAISLNPFYDLSSREGELMQEMTDNIYTRFCEIVGDGRNLPIERVREIAEGRVYTGLAAQKIGLVDEIGFLDDAIEMAAASAGLDSYKVIEYPEVKPDPVQQIISAVMAGSEAKLDLPMNNQTREMLKYYNEWYPILECADPQARMPYTIDFQ